MKPYTPKRLLRRAIKATQASLDGKWKLGNKNKRILNDVCGLCRFDDTEGDCSCSICPYDQYNIGCDSGGTYSRWIHRKSRANFMAVRCELQATLRWLKKQLPKDKT